MNKLKCFLGFHVKPEYSAEVVIGFNMSSTLDPKKIKKTTWMPCVHCGCVLYDVKVEYKP